ncbi:hypothetical protein [uncultured Alistipes sp.]|nr:hypothetical protein [uncultured Alistipes sp.]
MASFKDAINLLFLKAGNVPAEKKMVSSYGGVPFDSQLRLSLRI